MIRGTGYWTYDPEALAWYFAPDTRLPPPYKRQVRVMAVVDLDAEGNLAGIELIQETDAAIPKPPGYFQNKS